jgi:multidrug efflux pump subunit AcrA (membrane-fusion protein)
MRISKPGPKPGPRHGRLAVLAAAVALAAVAAGCTRGEQGRYATEQVRVGDVAERVTAPGSVQPAAQAQVRAPSDARISKLAVRNGQRVEPGQLIARLDSAQVDNSLRQAEAAASAASSGSLGGAVTGLGGGQLGGLDALQAEVGTAGEAVIAALRDLPANLPPDQRAAFERRLADAEARLAESRKRAAEAAAAAQRQAQAQGAALRQALDAMSAAQRAQAQAALDVARDAKQRLTLRAPIGGTVQLGRVGQTGGGTQLPSIPGLPAGAGQALQGLTGGGGGGGGGGSGAGPPLSTGAEIGAGQTVADIVDVDELHVAADVDETDIALVKAGQSAEIELDAFPGARFDAKVERIATTPTGSAQSPGAGGVTYQVDLLLGGVLPGAEGEAAGVEPVPRVGMTATADILVRESKGALTVASSALVGRGAGQGVLVVDGDVVRLRPVRLAASGEDRVAVSEGLRAGDVVVTRGAERLRDGQRYPGS